MFHKNLQRISGHILCSVRFPPPENRAVYVKMLKKIVEPERPQMKIQRMRFACWIPKAINTLSEYVILIAFPLQQCLHERNSMSRYTYIACLFIFPFLLSSVFSSSFYSSFFIFSPLFLCPVSIGRGKSLTLPPVLSSNDRNFFIPDPQIMR